MKKKQVGGRAYLQLKTMRNQITAKSITARALKANEARLEQKGLKKIREFLLKSSPRNFWLDWIIKSFI